MMAHFALRALMHEAALVADVDPDRLSFMHALRVVRRKLPAFNAIPPEQSKAVHECVMQELLSERLAERCGRRNRRGVKRKMSHWPLRRRQAASDPQMSFDPMVKIVK